MLKSFPLRQPKFGGNNKISSRANTNKIEKITSLKFLCSNVNVSVKNIWKVAWARGSEAFAPTFTLWLEAEKKAVEASYFEISVLQNGPFEAPVCNNVGYQKKNKISILTNRTKTKSWGDKLRNGRVWITNRIEA